MAAKIVSLLFSHSQTAPFSGIGKHFHCLPMGLWLLLPSGALQWNWLQSPCNPPQFDTLLHFSPASLLQLQSWRITAFFIRMPHPQHPPRGPSAQWWRHVSRSWTGGPDPVTVWLLQFWMGRRVSGLLQHTFPSPLAALSGHKLGGEGLAPHFSPSQMKDGSCGNSVEQCCWFAWGSWLYPAWVFPPVHCPLRSTLYHHLRLLMGFSRTVGIG